MSRKQTQVTRQATVEWHPLFERLSRQFEAASLKSGIVACTLTYQGERAHSKELPPIDLGKLPMFSGAHCVPSPTPTSPRRSIQYFGDNKDIVEFLRYAGEAGRYLLCLPESVVQPIGLQYLFVKDDATRWVWALFDLAWAGVPGLRYSAAKEIVWGKTRFPYDREQLNAMLNIGTWSPSKPERLVQWSNELPDWFVSDIRDLWAASLSAIDALLTPKRTLPLMTVGEQAIWNLLDGKALKGREIAEALGTSEQTIKEQVAAIRGKGLQLPNQPGRGYYRSDAPPPQIRVGSK